MDLILTSDYHLQLRATAEETRAIQAEEARNPYTPLLTILLQKLHLEHKASGRDFHNVTDWIGYLHGRDRLNSASIGFGGLWDRQDNLCKMTQTWTWAASPDNPIQTWHDALLTEGQITFKHGNDPEDPQTYDGMEEAVELLAFGRLVRTQNTPKSEAQ